MTQSRVQRMFSSFASETTFTLRSSLAALDAALEAAVTAEGPTTTDIFREFVKCLNDESKAKRCTSHICMRYFWYQG